MQNFRVIFGDYARSDTRLGTVYRQIAGRPSWVIKAALLAAAMVILIPAVLVMLAAICAFVVVLAVGTIVHRLTSGIERLLGPRPPKDQLIRPQDTGRVNVRVIYPEQR